MKKYVLIFVFIMVSNGILAQNNKVLDTIYANDHKSVALFFPEPIIQGITGAENFVFTYNRENQQHFGLLQAKPGQESNLLVIGARGSVYSYILRYKEQLSRLNYFIAEAESIGDIFPIAMDSVAKPKPLKTEGVKDEYFEKFSSHLLGRKQRIRRINKRSQGISLGLTNIVFNKEHLYFVIQVANKSSLDYDLNFLELSVQTRQKGKKKSAQSILKKPVFQYKIPAKIKAGQSLDLVYVFQKFSISKDRRLVLKLNEKNGERNIALKVSHRFINQPN